MAKRRERRAEEGRGRGTNRLRQELRLELGFRGLIVAGPDGAGEVQKGDTIRLPGLRESLLALPGASSWRPKSPNLVPDAQREAGPLYANAESYVMSRAAARS